MFPSYHYIIVDGIPTWLLIVVNSFAENKRKLEAIIAF
jgi:hypothetical protein